MSQSNYEIPVQTHHAKSLTFRMAPVSKAIMNAEADWITDDELCVDDETGRTLLLPFISESLKKPFAFGDEINILAFSGLKVVIRSLRETVVMLTNHYDDPAMKTFIDHIPAELLVGEEKRDAVRRASAAKKAAIRRENIGVLADFYTNVANALTKIGKSYGTKGFRHLAITSAYKE